MNSQSPQKSLCAPLFLSDPYTHKTHQHTHTHAHTHMHTKSEKKLCCERTPWNSTARTRINDVGTSRGNNSVFGLSR